MQPNPWPCPSDRDRSRIAHHDPDHSGPGFVNRYQLEQLIGDGGTSRVYREQDR
jgi:hypothetical protein